MGRGEEERGGRERERWGERGGRERERERGGERRREGRGHYSN